MPPLARRRAVAVLISLLILCLGAAPSQAVSLPGLPWKTRNASGSAKTVPVQAPNGRLQEVPAPDGVQQLRNRLSRHQPLVQLQNPKDGTVLDSEDATLTISVRDWPLVTDPDLGLGPHLALQIDDQPPQRFSSATTAADGTATLHISLPALTPGSHRFTAYAAYPWGEAVKSPGASQQWRLHSLQALRGTQPERDDPWLVMVSPAELGSTEPLLLDWMVWNAPLQNLRDGDGRWRLRVTLNGDSFLVDRQEAIWLRQSGTNQVSTKQLSTVQMELLDGLGDPIKPAFNNQLRSVPPRSASRPLWLQGRLKANDIARLLDEPQPPVEPTTRPTKEAAQTAAENTQPNSPTASSASTPDSAPQRAALPPQSESEDRDSINGNQRDPEGVDGAEDGRDNSDRRGHVDSTEEQDLTSSLQRKEAPPVVTSTRGATTGEAATKTNTPSQSTTSIKPERAIPAPDAPAESEAKSPSLTPTGEERLAPTTSLGGSARELLKSDGSKR